MRTFASPSEVRRCCRCEQPALICVRAWQHTVLGIFTHTETLDLQCQACGAKLTLHSQKRIAVERVFAYLMIPAIFPALIFFASARRKTRAWTDNPVVPGAMQPARIAASGARIDLLRDTRHPRDRACRCAHAAPCIKIAQRRMRGIRVGTRYDYACARCSQTFSVSDAAGIAFSCVAALALSAAGALIVAFPPGSAVDAERSNQWFGAILIVCGAFFWVQVVLRARGRILHPETT
ncbi:MAG: hypothetical protein ABI551_08540 [Polyangiaceae bacterium]